MPRHPIGKKIARARVSRTRSDPAPPPYEQPRAGKTKFDRTTCDKILAQVEAGDKPIVACRVVGVASETLRTWIKRAESGEERFIGFFEELQRSEAIAESRRRALVELAARGGGIPRKETDPKTGKEKIVGYDKPDAKAAQWLLENGSSRKRWGNVSRVEVTGKGGSPFGPANFAGWSKEQLERYAAGGPRPGQDEIKAPRTETSVDDMLDGLLDGIG